MTSAMHSASAAIKYRIGNDKCAGNWLRGICSAAITGREKEGKDTHGSYKVPWCHGANEVAKKEGRKKSRRSDANGERLKCNEVRSKKDDLIYLEKNTATPKRRGAHDEITEGPEIRNSQGIKAGCGCATVDPPICNQLNLPPTHILEII